MVWEIHQHNSPKKKISTEVTNPLSQTGPTMVRLISPLPRMKKTGWNGETAMGVGTSYTETKVHFFAMILKKRCI